MAIPAKREEEAAARRLFTVDGRQCTRCGGLLVREICIDLSNSGEWEIEARRCVQCGEMVDRVITANRRKVRLVAN
jgi:ribosomal protein S27AE